MYLVHWINQWFHLISLLRLYFGAAKHYQPFCLCANWGSHCHFHYHLEGKATQAVMFGDTCRIVDYFRAFKSL